MRRLRRADADCRQCACMAVACLLQPLLSTCLSEEATRHRQHRSMERTCATLRGLSADVQTQACRREVLFFEVSAMALSATTSAKMRESGRQFSFATGGCVRNLTLPPPHGAARHVSFAKYGLRCVPRERKKDETSRSEIRR